MVVVDGSTSTDCSTGGGAYAVVCKSNGSSWNAQTIGNGSGGSTVPYSQPFTAQTSVLLAHNLGTSNVIVSCYDSSNRLLSPGSLTITDSNDATVAFSSAQTGRCVVNGGVGPAGPVGPSGGVGSPPFAQSFTAQSSIVLAHNLGTNNVLVGCYDSSNRVIAPGSISVTDQNDVAVAFTSPATGRCVVNGGVGPAGQAGPAGPSGGIGSAPYSQSFTAQTSVSLAHNLGTSNVLVGCYDNSNRQLSPGSVVVTDINDVAVTFASAQTGRCVVNGGVGPTGGATSAIQTLSYSATPSVDFSQGTSVTITLTGNASPTFANIVAGATYHFLICQDATGGRTWNWGAIHGGAVINNTNVAGTCTAQDLRSWGTTAANIYATSPAVANQ